MELAARGTMKQVGIRKIYVRASLGVARKKGRESTRDEARKEDGKDKDEIGGGTENGKVEN